jgi:hypothetical protein
MAFPAGYAETIFLVYQRSMVADSNGWIIARIYSLARREKGIFIFDASESSEQPFSDFSQIFESLFLKSLQLHSSKHFNFISQLISTLVLEFFQF